MTGSAGVDRISGSAVAAAPASLSAHSGGSDRLAAAAAAVCGGGLLTAEFDLSAAVDPGSAASPSGAVPAPALSGSGAVHSPFLFDPVVIPVAVECGAFPADAVPAPAWSAAVVAHSPALFAVAGSAAAAQRPEVVSPVAAAGSFRPFDFPSFPDRDFLCARVNGQKGTDQAKRQQSSSQFTFYICVSHKILPYK